MSTQRCAITLTSGALQRILAWGRRRPKRSQIHKLARPSFSKKAQVGGRGIGRHRGTRPPRSKNFGGASGCSEWDENRVWGTGWGHRGDASTPSATPCSLVHFLSFIHVFHVSFLKLFFFLYRFFYIKHHPTSSHLNWTEYTMQLSRHHLSACYFWPQWILVCYLWLLDFMEHMCRAALPGPEISSALPNVLRMRCANSFGLVTIVLGRNVQRFYNLNQTTRPTVVCILYQ